MDLIDPAALQAAVQAADERLRVAGADDAAALCALLRRLAETEWAGVPARLDANIARYLALPGASFTLLAQERGAAVGFVIVQVMPVPAEGAVQLCIDDLFVEPSRRRRGLGAALVSGVRLAGHLLDACYIYLHVRHDNDAARRLYETLGFEAATDVLYEWYRDPAL